MKTIAVLFILFLTQSIYGQQIRYIEVSKDTTISMSLSSQWGVFIDYRNLEDKGRYICRTYFTGNGRIKKMDGHTYILSDSTLMLQCNINPIDAIRNYDLHFLPDSIKITIIKAK